MKKLHRHLRKKPGTSWGYECSRYVEVEAEGAYLEKQLMNGCRTLVTISGSSLLPTCELLQDLSGTGDISLNRCFYGHRLVKPSPQASLEDCLDRWTQELTQMQTYLAKCGSSSLGSRTSSVDALAVPSSFVLDLLNKAGRDMDEAGLSKSFGELKQRLFSCVQLTRATAVSEMQFGIDFSTEELLSMSDDDMESLQQVLVDHTCRNMTETLTAGRSQFLSVVMVASNALTFSRSQLLLSFAKSLGLRTMATESLRTKPRGPSLLTFPGNRDPDGVNVGTAANQDVIQEFKKALDICLHAEKQFIPKLRSVLSDSSQSPQIDVGSLMWGHSLLKQFDFIESIEEWQYLKSSQVDPGLATGLGAIQAMSKEGKDWSSVYKPFVLRLFRSYHDLLEDKKRVQYYRVLAALQQGGLMGSNEVSLSAVIGLLGSSVGADYCLFGGNNSNLLKQSQLADSKGVVSFSKASETWTQIYNCLSVTPN